jgi:hypothetical protein
MRCHDEAKDWGRNSNKLPGIEVQPSPDVIAASAKRDTPVQNRSIPGPLHNTLLGRYEALQPRPGRLGGMQSLHSPVRSCVFVPARTPCVVGH